ncbi:MAG: DegQ family serine endoprotease [Verrucomicrobia bacterium]|nr:DegQ family serine endoprotease [Verrucomicrobiota bacterium]
MKPIKFSFSRRTAVTALAACGVAAGLSLAMGANMPTGLNLKTDDKPINRDSRENSFAPIVKQVSPSVVKIFVTMKEQSQIPRSELDQFKRFFGPNFDFEPNQQEQHVLGSGVIVSPDGYILTNNHVVDNAKEIQIATVDGHSYTGHTVGTDPDTDVALLKIDATNLPAITLADSDKVEVGDVVLAIGNPFGIGETVTRGIVSAKNRATAGDKDENFIQTDAAINPGNSGGALVDVEGRLVGINTEILSRSGGNQGIGFAVPSDICKWVMDSLIKNGRVIRGYLGIAIQNLTPDLAKAFNLDRATGALVADVTTNSAAQAAGIKSGDVVLQFNNKDIEDAAQLKVEAAETLPGTTIPVLVDRNGQKVTVNVTIREKPSDKVAKNNTTPSQGDQDALTGVTVSDLNRQIRSELNIPDDVNGAVITEVDPSCASYAAGLRAGDVITEINHDPVKNAEDAVNKTEKRGDGSTLVKLWSKGATEYVAVQNSR